MSKAIQGAALLGGAVLTGAAAFALASTGVGTAAIPFLMAAMKAEVLGGLSMEAGAISNALTSGRGSNITLRQAAAYRQIIYGEQRVGGVIVYYSTTGRKYDQNNVVIVLAGHVVDSIVNLYVDGRQVFWNPGSTGNTTRNGVNFGGSADYISHTGPSGQQYNFGNVLYCEAKFGDQAPGDVIGGLTANDPSWAASVDGSPYVGGCTYVYLKWESNSDQFNAGIPEFRFTIRGKNDILDPRTGTRGWTNNWALICADVVADSKFGLNDAAAINTASLIASANVCDEQVEMANPAGPDPGVIYESRYTTNCHYDSSTAPGDALQLMMPGAAGRYSFIGGEHYFIPAYWQGPSFTFDQSHLTGPLSWTSKRPFAKLFNRVNGTYIAPNLPYNIAGNLYDSNGFAGGSIQNNFAFAFQPTDFPAYACDVRHGYAADQYFEEDSGILGVWDGSVVYGELAAVRFGGKFYQSLTDANTGNQPDVSPSDWQVWSGVPLVSTISFQTVLSVSQAQRVAKIMLRRNRQQGSGIFPMSLEAWQMQEYDVMHFTFPDFGWEEKVLEVEGCDWTCAPGRNGVPEVRTSFRVIETAASVYEWSPIEELTVYNVPALSASQGTYAVAPPTNMALTSSAGTAVTGIDGVIRPRVLVTWDEPLDVLVTQIQVQRQLVPASGPVGDWEDEGSVTVDSTSAYVADVVAGSTYNFRIRSLRASGATSVWVEIDGYTVTITLSVLNQLALAPGSLIAEAYIDGTAAIKVQPFTAVVGNLTVSCLPAGEYVLPGLAQSTLYFVYYIDPTFLGGAITPIATTNKADFLNKPGYFLIDSKVTPFRAAGATRYSPTSYNDNGSRSTQYPASAYDGDVTTEAIVSSLLTPPSGSGQTTGDIVYVGFPSVTSTALATVKVVLTPSIDVVSGASGGTIECSLVGSATGSFSTITASSGQVTVSGVVPLGTALGALGVEITSTATAQFGTHTTRVSAAVAEVYIDA